MSITIELSPDEEKIFANAARRRGVTPMHFARQALLNNLTAPEATPQPTKDKTLALFAQWEAEDATDDAEEIAHRTADWEALKANLNANRAAEGEPPLFS